jgi:hypothetical protein
MGFTPCSRYYTKRRKSQMPPLVQRRKKKAHAKHGPLFDTPSGASYCYFVCCCCPFNSRKVLLSNRLLPLNAAADGDRSDPIE